MIRKRETASVNRTKDFVWIEYFTSHQVWTWRKFRPLTFYSIVEYLLIDLPLLFCTDYSIEREHAGLRRIAGYGVTVTRGAASGMMFTYSCLLVTMCRNTITFLRETMLHRFIPFDGAIAMHKYIAFVALFFTSEFTYWKALNFINLQYN